MFSHLIAVLVGAAVVYFILKPKADPAPAAPAPADPVASDPTVDPTPVTPGDGKGTDVLTPEA